MSTPVWPLHEQRHVALEAVRRNSAKAQHGVARTNGGHVNPFRLEGRLAFLRGEPFLRNESDPWRTGWIEAQHESRLTRPAA